MKVILSGFNLDIDTIVELKNFVKRFIEVIDKNSTSRGKLKSKTLNIDQLYKDAIELFRKDNLTPETISAAYARISRNPKPVNELRSIARQEVDKARRSNKSIIFGLGHSSVAEHTIFNFDILGVSRLAVETIEHFRIASYTEKSQRYILFKNNYIIPEEIKNSTFLNDYNNLIKEQNNIYYKLYKALRPYFLTKNKEIQFFSTKNPRHNIRLYHQQNASYPI